MLHPLAYIIHQCGTERYIRPWGILMQHQMSLGAQDQYYNLKAYISLIDKIHKKLLAKQAATAGLSADDFNELTRHDMWLLGDESIERGFADKVVNVVCDFKPETVTEVRQTCFGDVTLVFSTCPLASKPIEVKFSGLTTAGMTAEQIKLAREQIMQQYDANYFFKSIEGINTDKHIANN